MQHLETIYRNFDIRGHYPSQINETEVHKIARALTALYNWKIVAIGRDNRPSSTPLFSAMTDGFIAAGVDVVDLGLVTTPMTYFAAGSGDYDATAMITASHMTSEFNGLKICKAGAIPLSVEEIQAVRAYVENGVSSNAVVSAGSVTNADIRHAWQQYFLSQFSFKDAGLSVVIDPANMIGVLEIELFKQFEGLNVSAIFDTLDPDCPNHEANPMKTETLRELAKKVVATRADLGIAFDGDADRVGFVDETGAVVPNDLIGGLLTRVLLAQEPGASIVYDVRSSRILPEVITELAGVPIVEKVGHSNIRPRMRTCGAPLGIELSGHFFFKQTFYSEGGPLPALLIMQLMKETGKPLSELVAALKVYSHSGEINSTISQTPEAIYEALKSEFPNASFSYLDGLSIETDNWWCNVRPSANDPVMRLNLEAKNPEIMQEQLDKVLAIIRQ